MKGRGRVKEEGETFSRCCEEKTEEMKEWSGNDYIELYVQPEW